MFLVPAQQGTGAMPPNALPASDASALPHLQQTLRTRPPRLSAWDCAGMLAGFLLILAVTVVNSRGRVFWEDELLGWMLLRDPSWHHMVRAWNLGADGGGFSFYLLGRAWFRVFGASVLTFRLFSGTCFGLAFAILWAALRRFYSIGVVALAVINSLLFSPPLTTHFIEGRFYGLLVLSTALTVWLALALDAAPRPTPRWLYLSAFVIHALLTTSHVLGVVYSAALLGATVVLDRMHGRRRVPLYLTIAAAWLLLLPEWTSIAAAGRVGKPHFWTKAPTPGEILGGWTGFSHEIQFVLAVLVCLAAAALVRQPDGFWTGLRRSFVRRRPAYIVGGSLLLVPALFLLEGLVGTWLFTDRYLQPVILGVALLTAELTALACTLPSLEPIAERRPMLRRLGLTTAACAYGLFTFVWVFHHVAENTPEPVDFTAQLTTHLPHTLPVVVEDAFTFTSLLATEAHSGVHYTFLLDWPWAVDPEAPRLEVTQYHLMENWKLAGYFPDRITNAASFLTHTPRFLVIHNGPIVPDPKQPKPEIGNPFAARLATDPAYEVRPYFVLDRRNRDGVRDTVWLVCRGSCDTSPVAAQEPQHCQISAKGTDCCNGFTCPLPEPQAAKPFWRRTFWNRSKAATP